MLFWSVNFLGVRTNMSDAVLTEKTVSVGGRWLWHDQRNSGILVRLVGSLCILKSCVSVWRDQEGSRAMNSEGGVRKNVLLSSPCTVPCLVNVDCVVCIVPCVIYVVPFHYIFSCHVPISSPMHWSFWLCSLPLFPVLCSTSCVPPGMTIALDYLPMFSSRLDNTTPALVPSETVDLRHMFESVIAFKPSEWGVGV